MAVVLLILLALEILPCAYLESPTLSTDGPSGFACSIEPLQVCDNGDSFFGVLADLTVLVPGGPVIDLTPEVRSIAADGTRFVPERFVPAIDHPPQLFA